MYHINNFFFFLSNKIVKYSQRMMYTTCTVKTNDYISTSSNIVMVAKNIPNIYRIRVENWMIVSIKFPSFMSRSGFSNLEVSKMFQLFSISFYYEILYRATENPRSENVCTYFNVIGRVGIINQSYLSEYSE